MNNNPVKIVLAGVLTSLTFVANAQCPADPILRIDTHTLDMQEKKPICVPSPGEFQIRIKPASGLAFDPASVSVEEKEENQHDGEIRDNGIVQSGPFYVLTIRVDEGFGPGTEPGYEIEIEGIGELDPRVRVTNNRALQSLGAQQYTDVEAFLNSNFRITTDEVVAIERYLRKQGLSAEELVRLTDDYDAMESN